MAWARRGSERQSLDRGDRNARGTAATNRPVKSRAATTVLGTCAAEAPKRAMTPGDAGLGSRARSPPGAIERHLPRPLGVVGLEQCGAATLGFEAVQESGEQDRARTVHVGHVSKVELHAAATAQRRFGVGQRPLEGHRVGKREPAAEQQPGLIALTMCANDDTHVSAALTS